MKKSRKSEYRTAEALCLILESLCQVFYLLERGFSRFFWYVTMVNNRLRLLKVYKTMLEKELKQGGTEE